MGIRLEIVKLRYWFTDIMLETVIVKNKYDVSILNIIIIHDLIIGHELKGG